MPQRLRQNVASDLSDTLRDMVADGKLAAGSRVNESELSHRLQVSRTPLREALARVEGEGFVVSYPRRGYFVPAMDAKRVRDLYQLRVVIAPAALELAGLPSRARARRLARLVRDRGRTAPGPGAIEERMELREAWHLELVQACPNPLLLSLSRILLLRTRPLERAYLRMKVAERSYLEEEEGGSGDARIAALLVDGDLPGAVAALTANLHGVLEARLEWLRENPPTAEQMRRG